MPLAIALQAAALAPVKLGLQIRQRSLASGETGDMTIQLLDSANQPAAASKPMHIALQARLSSGKVLGIGAVDFAAGESTKHVSRSMPATGLMYVWAKNPEMLPGGQFVNVREESKVAPSLPSELHASRPLPQITLRYSPQRNFLADGKDAANVEAFLVGDISSYPQDVRLNIFDSSHALTPTPLTIPAGQPFGEASVTSTTPGTVSVEFLGSSPSAAFQGDKALNISFVPPITHVRLEASPPSISLVDLADVLVTLTDEGGRTLSPGTPRKVGLALTLGRGHLSSQEVTIPAGQIQARATFVPESPGTVTIEAHTDNLATVGTQFQVGVPFALLLCSAIGGALGGFLTQRTRRKIDRYRVPIGIVTGFIFYWGCIFLGLANIGRAFILNPLSAGVLSAIGGWLQTKVFNVVWGAVRAPQKAT